MPILYLFATIAGQYVAFDASAVESVIEIDVIAPVPRAPAHIAGLAALRSRVLTIIDSHAALGLDSRLSEPAGDLIVVTVDGHLYGLRVDHLEDVAMITVGAAPVPAAIAAGWAHAARGIVEHDGRAALLVDPAALVAGLPALAA